VALPPVASRCHHLRCRSHGLQRAEIEAGTRPGTTTADNVEIVRLKKKNAELRRANEILKTASAFFAAAELDRKLS
jgi:transposase